MCPSWKSRVNLRVFSHGANSETGARTVRVPAALGLTARRPPRARARQRRWAVGGLGGRNTNVLPGSPAGEGAPVGAHLGQMRSGSAGHSRWQLEAHQSPLRTGSQRDQTQTARPRATAPRECWSLSGARGDSTPAGQALGWAAGSVWLKPAARRAGWGVRPSQALCGKDACPPGQAPEEPRSP